MNFELVAGIITDVLRYASCAKTATSKPLIPSVILTMDEKKLFISGMEPSGMLQSGVVLKRDNIDLVSDTDGKYGIDTERILKVLGSLDDKVNISVDEEKIHIRGNNRYYSENLPTDVTEPAVDFKFKDNAVPVPVLYVDDGEEKKELKFDAVLKFKDKPKIPVPFSTDTMSIVVEDKQAIINITDEISEFKDVLTTDIKWNTEPTKLDLTFNSTLLKTVLSLIEGDTALFVHQRIAYCLTNTPWGYVGYLMPVWGSV